MVKYDIKTGKYNPKQDLTNKMLTLNRTAYKEYGLIKYNHYCGFRGEFNELSKNRRALYQAPTFRIFTRTINRDLWTFLIIFNL